MSDFLIRHYVPETDLSPLARMLTEIELIDRDGEETSEEYSALHDGVAQLRC